MPDSASSLTVELLVSPTACSDERSSVLDVIFVVSRLIESVEASAEDDCRADDDDTVEI